jgi:hypothetical protein
MESDTGEAAAEANTNAERSTEDDNHAHKYRKARTIAGLVSQRLILRSLRYLHEPVSD